MHGLRVIEQRCDPVTDQPFKVMRRDPPCRRSGKLIGARDIIAIALPRLVRVTGRHHPALAIEDPPGEQAVLLRPDAPGWSRGPGLDLFTHGLPQRTRHTR